LKVLRSIFKGAELSRHSPQNILSGRPFFRICRLIPKQNASTAMSFFEFPDRLEKLRSERLRLESMRVRDCAIVKDRKGLSKTALAEQFKSTRKIDRHTLWPTIVDQCESKEKKRRRSQYVFVQMVRLGTRSA
jgi:hypothetical protein